MNVLHLVLGAKNDHYSLIEKAARETWLTKCPDNIKTIFLYGGSDKIYWDEKESFYVNIQESLHICLYKTICAYEFFLDSDFDYIFRSNCTGYFDLNNVNAFLKDKPLKNYYCGCKGLLNDIEFASGSGYFLSKDLVSEIVANKKNIFEYNIPGFYDDVSIGKFITKHLNIPINRSAKRLDLTYDDIDSNLDLSHYHYRILFKGNSDSLYKIHKLKYK